MAQRIITLCDAHQETTGEDVLGTAWEVSLLAPGASRPTTWSVDLCEDHGKELEDLAKMLGTVGRVLEGPRGAGKQSVARQSTPAPATSHTAPSAAPTAQNACPVDGCDYKGPNRSSLNSHLRHQHSLTRAKAFGQPEPYACPAPGCGFRSSRPQGIGAHVHGAHGGSVSAS